jgi:hypothetical protein
MDVAGGVAGRPRGGECASPLGETPIARGPGDLHHRDVGGVTGAAPRVRADPRRPNPPRAARGAWQSVASQLIPKHTLGFSFPHRRAELKFHASVRYASFGFRDERATGPESRARGSWQQPTTVAWTAWPGPRRAPPWSWLVALASRRPGPNRGLLSRCNSCGGSAEGGTFLG